jgi:hypothetical protein
MAVVRQTIASRGVNLLGGIVVGLGGGTISSVSKRGTFSASSAAIAAWTALTTEVTVSGATTGDFAVVFGSSSLNAGLTLEAIAPCYATSQVNATFINHTSLSITMTTALSNSYILIKLST